MLRIEMELLKKYQRPIILIQGIKSLIDTGAIIPVFYYSGNVIKRAFNGKKINNEKVSFGGFGGVCTGDIYRLPDFSIGGLCFEELDVFIPDDDPVTKYPLILPATLFWGMKYTIDTIGSRLIIECEKKDGLIFHIENLKDKLYAQINGILLQEQNLSVEDMAVGGIG